MNWKDISSYSQGDRERIPRIWNCRIGRMSITVHRHIHYPDWQWLLSCMPFFTNHELPFQDVEMAKEEAIKLVLIKLKKIIKELKEGQS